MQVWSSLRSSAPARLGALALLAVLLLGSGCSNTNPNVDNVNRVGDATVLGPFSYNVTKKMPWDHVVSSLTGRNCSMVSLEQTGYYCPPEIEVVRPDTYCYRTLAGVDCHAIPDPYQNGNVPLASPPVTRRLAESEFLTAPGPKAKNLPP